MCEQPNALSVVVPTRDRPEFLDRCLAALRASCVSDDEVIVVDSCSRSDATSKVALAYRFKLVRCGVPGASRARNAGWRSAINDVVAFVDDDVEVAPGWAVALRRVMKAHPETSFVTGRVGLRPQDFDAVRPVALFDHPEAFPIDAGVTDHFGHGANLAVRRGALEAVHGYDEQLGPGARWHAAEDLDLIDRLLSSGFTGLYEPSVAAVHAQWRGRLALLGLEWRYGVGHGARLARPRTTDRSRFLTVSRIVWKEQGTRTLLRCLRDRYEFGALSAVLRLSGTALGQATVRITSGRPSARTRPARD